MTLEYTDGDGRSLWVVAIERPLAVNDRPVAEDVGDVRADLYYSSN